MMAREPTTEEYRSCYKLTHLVAFLGQTIGLLPVSRGERRVKTGREFRRVSGGQNSPHPNFEDALLDATTDV